MAITAQSSEASPDHNFDHLRTPNSSHRLNQIERIRATGAGELVALPQLVVCGDQSAGKSSVLEGITGIPFPRQEGLCTRFPTEIVLQHADIGQTTIVADIRPHSSRTPQDFELLTAYRKNVADMSELPLVINEVSRLMGVRGHTEFADSRAFASDVLRIQISGPIGLHLSVVDLPGLISVENEHQSEDDVDAVRDMVSGYLQNSRTIILAVLQAGNDMSNQPIIKLARKYDPSGTRTVGIITKPDLINRGSEAKIALVAKNMDSIKFKLGFFLLKNPAPAESSTEMTMDARSKLELAFFSTPAWKAQNLDESRVGVVMLRIYLQRLLDSHIEKELPKVREEIKNCLTQLETDLALLGGSRGNITEIRSYLTGLSMRFYELLKSALDGNYHQVDSRFFDTVTSRLRASVQEKNTKFAAFMRTSGERRTITTNAEPSSSESSDSAGHYETTNETSQLIVDKAKMTQWVKQVYSRTRGRELPGNYNSALLAELFREQSQRWFKIAEDHVRDILLTVSNWLDEAVANLIADNQLSVEIKVLLQQWLQNAERKALEELAKLREDERRDPLTYNHYYTDNIQKSRLGSQQDALQQAVDSVAIDEFHGKLHISNIKSEISKFVGAVGVRIIVDMDEKACSDAITELRAYYKVSMKTFVDNVARQVIERHIVYPLPQAFCPNAVSMLSDEILVQIGSESQQQVTRREKLMSQIQTLQESLRELQMPVHSVS